MAKARWYTGFEGGNGYDLSTVSTGAIVADGSARSGDFHVSLYTPASGTMQVRRTLSPTPEPLNNTDNLIARQQIALRWRMLPTTNNQQIFGFGIGSSVAPNQNLSVTQSANGQIAFAGQIGISGSLGTWVPTLGTWYVARLHFQYQKNNLGTSPTSVQLQIYDGLTLDTANPVLLATGSFAGSVAMAGWQLTPLTTLGSNSAYARIIDYDDWWVSWADNADAGPVPTTDLNWPRGSRVQAVPILGQSVGGWAGSYLLARDLPNSEIAGNEQTTATPSAISTFTHQTAAELGLIPVSIAAAADVPDTPPFTGAPFPEGINAGSGGLVLFQFAQDNTLPTPTLDIDQVAGAGLFNNGVFVRAFTVRMEGNGSSINYRVGPLSATTFLSASAYPNFAAQVDVSFGAGTPTDAITGAATYVRYGLGLIVTNAYNAAGLLNPTTSVTNQPSAQTNTTNLNTLGGPTAIDAGPFGALVALSAYLMPQGTSVPYPFTNPANRPSAVRFLLSSPRQGVGNAGFGGSGQGPVGLPTQNNFSAIFVPPAQQAAADAELPIVEAIKLVPALQRLAGSGTDAGLIAGVSYPIATDIFFGGSTLNQYAFDWGEKTAAEWDALVFGVQASGTLATTLRLGSCVCEVLTAGPCTRRTPGSGQYQQQAGIFVSNNSFQKVSLPFRASAVLLKRIGTAATPGSFKAWWMGGTQSWVIDSLTPVSTAVLLIEDDGFVVGPHNAANGVAATYAYLAVKDGLEDTVNDAYMVTGSYQRQGTTDPDQIVELQMPPLFAASWTPDVVQLFGASILKTPAMVSPDSDAFSTTGLITTGITAVGDKTFTTGTTASGPGQWPYWAFRFDAAGLLATLYQVGSFAGSGIAQVIATLFRGELVVLDHPAAGYTGRFRSDQGNTGSDSVPWTGGAVTTVDITAIANLSFTAGTGASVAGQTSYWQAWKKDGSIGNTGGTGLPVDPPDPDNPPDASTDLCGGGGMRVPAGTIGTKGCTKC